MRGERKNLNSTCISEEQCWCHIVLMGVYMVKHAAYVFLAVSGHKYPDGEHTPGKNTKHTWLTNPKYYLH